MLKSIKLTRNLNFDKNLNFAQEDATNLCRKGNNQRSIRECPPMIFDYKNQTLFVKLIFQDAIHFIKNQHSSRGIKSH